jgi:hypothetical protein
VCVAVNGSIYQNGTIDFFGIRPVRAFFDGAVFNGDYTLNDEKSSRAPTTLR